jgi:hypothetical protein
MLLQICCRSGSWEARPAGLAVSDFVGVVAGENRAVGI